MKASAGFKNLGQFVAAVNVSNNLGIPFSQLKTKMVDDGMSLGQSIQDAPAGRDLVGRSEPRRVRRPRHDPGERERERDGDRVGEHDDDHVDDHAAQEGQASGKRFT